MEQYYDEEYEDRYSTFIGDMSKSDFYEMVIDYTKQYTNKVDWPLMAGIEITETQSEAIAQAFTDFIWEEYTNEQA